MSDFSTICHFQGGTKLGFITLRCSLSSMDHDGEDEMEENGEDQDVFGKEVQRRVSFLGSRSQSSEKRQYAGSVHVVLVQVQRSAVQYNAVQCNAGSGATTCTGV